MVRDTTEGKTNFLNVLFGPMLVRWATHLTKGRGKYPDPEPGVPNWTLAQGIEECLRAKESAFRHMLQWLRGDRDEDHAAAVFFNINLAEYVREKLARDAAYEAAADELYPGDGEPTCSAVSPSGYRCVLHENHTDPRHLAPVRPGVDAVWTDEGSMRQVARDESSP